LKFLFRMVGLRWTVQAMSGVSPDMFVFEAVATSHERSKAVSDLGRLASPVNDRFRSLACDGKSDVFLSELSIRCCECK